MSFSESFFESASAYSTTGLSSFKDFVDGRFVFDSVPGQYHFEAGASFCPRIFCFHRAQMQSVGGVGLVLLLPMVLGESGGMSLYVGEGHGDRLLPNLRRSATRIFGIYLLYNIVGALALFLAGMEPYDAVVTSMSALSGGGFSPRSSNIAFYSGAGVGNGFYPASSLAIEIVMMLLVILSGISFVLHTFLLSGRFKDFFKDDEVRFFLSMLLFGFLVSLFGAMFEQKNVLGKEFFDDLPTNIRNVLFYVVSAETTSGFANTSLTHPLSLHRVDAHRRRGWKHRRRHQAVPGLHLAERPILPNPLPKRPQPHPPSPQ